MSWQLRERIRIEKEIATQFVKDAIAAGYWLALDNGGDELEVKPTGNTDVILAAMFEVDDEHLYVYPAGKVKDEDSIGWVYFVYGNDGWDVINDYTTNLEPIMAGADALAEKYGA